MTITGTVIAAARVPCDSPVFFGAIGRTDETEEDVITGYGLAQNCIVLSFSFLFFFRGDEQVPDELLEVVVAANS
jgi:hypothetical protein